MIGRLGAVLGFVLILVGVTSIGEALALRLGSAGPVLWAVALAIAVVAMVMAFQAPDSRTAWGRLLFVNGVSTLALVPPSLLAHSSMLPDYNPEIVSEAEARYAAWAALSSYLPIIALMVAAVLIGVALLLLHPKSSRSARHI